MMLNRKILVLGAPTPGKSVIWDHFHEKIEILVFDYRRIIIDGEKNYLFNLPGDEQFTSLPDVLSDDTDGIIIFVEVGVGFTEIDIEIINLIDHKRIPYVIFADKKELTDKNLIIPFNNALIFPTIVKEGIGINDGLKLLLKLIDQNKTQYLETDKLKTDNYKKTGICKLKLFIHPIELENVKKALEKLGFSNITLIDVKYVDQKARKKEIYRASTFDVNLPPKIEIDMIIRREDIKYVVKTIEEVKTEDINDHIIISSIDNVIRIRTEERGKEAIE